MKDPAHLYPSHSSNQSPSGTIPYEVFTCRHRNSSVFLLHVTGYVLNKPCKAVAAEVS